jgi:transcriptional regulator with XRE-family HTH domain
MLSVSPSSDAEKKRIGERIAEARRAKGLTQRALADLVGVKERAVQGWEQGETHPYRRLPILERVLDRDREWLLGATAKQAPRSVRETSATRISDLIAQDFGDDELTQFDRVSIPRRRSLTQSVEELMQHLDDMQRRLDELERVVAALQRARS